MIWLVICEGLAITIIGSLLHFTYGWSKRNKVVGIFSAVNESTWEHIKLAISGILACILVDVWWLGDNPNYWLARGISLLVPVVVIPLIFYGYQRITHHPILVIDISSFIVAAFLSAYVFALVLDATTIDTNWINFGLILSLVILVMYLLLTRFPLHNFFFRDPITGCYGTELPRKRRTPKKSSRRR